MALPLARLHSGGAIDFDCNFIPEHLTALFYTRSYKILNHAQKLKYNQLCYLYLSEHVVIFERTFDRYMRSLLRRNVLPALFVDKIQRWLAEEEVHTRLFRKLNEQIDPRYAQSDALFVSAPGALVRCFLAGTFKLPELFPMYLLFMALQEERSAYYCSVYQERRGMVEDRIADLQLVHGSDEMHHVTLNLELFKFLWAGCSRPVQTANAKLFIWMMGEFFIVPKRAGLKILQSLCDYFPELQTRMPAMRADLIELRHSAAFHEAQYSRKMVPVTFGVLDRIEAFADLSKKLYSYTRETYGR